MALSAGNERASLAVRLKQAERLLVEKLSPELTERDLTLDHWRMLCVLAAHPGLPMSSLAVDACVPAPSLTRYVDKLAQRGVIIRTTDPHDRRKVVVALSVLGKQIHAELSPVERAIEHDVASEFAVL